MGGGIGMGNTCKPMAVSFQCMTKSTTNKKKKKFKKKKITESRMTSSLKMILGRTNYMHFVLGGITKVSGK